MKSQMCEVLFSELCALECVNFGIPKTKHLNKYDHESSLLATKRKFSQIRVQSFSLYCALYFIAF